MLSARSQELHCYYVMAFLMCVCVHIHNNTLVPAISIESTPILYADDTSIIISYPEIDHFHNCMTDVFGSFNKWFKPLMPNENNVSHQLQQSVTLNFVFMGFV
jgi:hypothetical protein